MSKGLIKCPECGAEFELSQAVSHDIEVEVAKKYQKQIKDLEEKASKETEVKEQELNKKLQDEREKFNKKEKELSDQIEAAKKEAEDKAKKKAEESIKLELEDLKAQLQEKDDKLAEGQKQELELRKKQRELEEREKAAELEMARKLDEERSKIKEVTLKTYEEEHRLKDAEKDKQLADMRKQIDDLKRKAEQGSQQNQGEVLELELEDMLKEEFVFDEIDPVSKGVKGGDVIQTVKTQSGRVCGKILWETKRTKTWSDKWLQKLKDDQRDAKADVAVIVSEVLPPGLTHFRQIEGVWVASLGAANSLALALRVILTKVAVEKSLQEGKAEKKELVYNYLTGPEFRNRVEAIVESFVGMKEDLDREKRAMNKIWDKREKQIERVVLNIGGMQGDIEGLAGMSLPKIEILELPEAYVNDDNQDDEENV
ncbi:MAG: DUF2130 domain-containing protein [Candidatus Omnitrophica bacterium]|nr:DUF2130 domain-containing protein [Candidatus Omnitrophota bacterium]MDD5488300.1 DUF2130 domain-containing protein [Candidatus Omnitrophota bacterium]